MSNSHPIEIQECAGDEHPAAAADGAGAGDAAPPLDPDAEYLHKMRGWLMMVATLFVGMSFQAALHPPLWIRQEYIASMMVSLRQLSFDSKTNADVLFRGISDGSLPPVLFIAFNALTFVTGITLLIKLVTEKAPSTSDINGIVLMVKFLTICAAYTFAFGICPDLALTVAILCTFPPIAVITFIGIKLPALWMSAYAGIAFVVNRSLAPCKIVWNRFTTKLDGLSRKWRASGNRD